MDFIIEFLLELTGRDVATYTYTDLARATLALLVLSIATYKPTDRVLDGAWKLLLGGGVALIGLKLVGGSYLDLISAYSHPLLSFGGIALNVLVLGTLGVLAFRARLISNAHLKLLIGLAVTLPFYPYLIVFPLESGLFAYPFNIFATALITNLILLLFLELLFRAALFNPPHKDTPPLAAAFGKRVDVENLNKTDGFLLYEQGDPTLSGLATEGIGDYLHWRNTAENIPRLPSFAALDDNDDLYLAEYADHIDGDIPDDVLDDIETRFRWLATQDAVWVTDGPDPTQFILIALVLSLVVGNPLLYLVF